jgi:site-specific DNA-methyltransferase (adenine-specific)
MIRTKLIYGECLEKMDELIKQNIKVDMILCDLPYETTIAKWDKMISLDLLWDKYSKLIKENGVVVLFSSQPFTSKLIMSNLKWFKEEIIWQKDRASNFAQAKRRHLKYHENIEIFAPNKYTYNRQMQPRESQRMKQMQDNNNINFRSSISNRKDNEIVFNIDDGFFNSALYTS